MTPPIAKTLPLTWDMFNIERREVVCLVSALLIHSLLLFWKGMPFQLLDEAKKDLGEVLVQVTFQSELPDLDAAMGRAAPKKKMGFVEKMRKFFKDKPKKDPALLAIRKKQTPIEIKKPAWTKAQKSLKSRTFTEQSEFKANQNKDDTTIAKGTSRDLALKKLEPQAKSTNPTLKPKSYKLAKKDSPFKIYKAKRDDVLAMNNVVPVNVGRTTSREIKSLNTKSDGPSLTSKAFNKRDGLSSGRGSVKGTGKGGLLATGAGGSQIGGITPSLDTGPGANQPGLVGKPSTTGRTNLAHSGSKVTQTGFASETGTSPTGKKSGIAGSGQGGGDSRFSITGALANRKPLNKVFPKATADAKVSLKFRVDWLGRVLDGIVVLISSGSPSFDRNVIKALKKWVFSKLSAAKSNIIQQGVITFIFRGV